ncbi:hypothetical protein K505DRAFT_327861 [Melanomma pulvis-pyrius CBS 109.77]|uniref:Pinin/SDK/MemA protein domain-containing protein n=1 Tax=Melanomma pulvis-pyrius CBS 109.77 TaxID=1314802 RepID=A0A6A6X1E0_9PLEO|nr:hypothetical protein K505DRAFT_327861 [Melanomma pulvis-pyrius CBS 109.77]
MAGPIASAVMLPEPQEPEALQPAALSPSAHKRRQSSTSEQDAKRQRVNSTDASADRRNSIDAKPSVAATPRKERGRERRLFGAALGALSQNSATAAQKRRSEIEKRQQAQRKIDEEENEQRKLERETQRKAQRQKEQKQFERDSMQIRHDNLLSMAHFLRTKSEPGLYYKPWATSAEEDDRIRYQIAEAHETIRRELDEYEALHEPERERDVSREGDIGRDAGAPGNGKESNADTPQHRLTANGGTNDSASAPKDPELREDHAEGLTNKAVSGERAVQNSQDSIIASHESTGDESSKDVMDENGEEVLEAAEDTVIY